jgi:hypothetical protein
MPERDIEPPCGLCPFDTTTETWIIHTGRDLGEERPAEHVLGVAGQPAFDGIVTYHTPLGIETNCTIWQCIEIRWCKTLRGFRQLRFIEIRQGVIRFNHGSVDLCRFPNQTSWSELGVSESRPLA